MLSRVNCTGAYVPIDRICVPYIVVQALLTCHGGNYNILPLPSVCTGPTARWASPTGTTDGFPRKILPPGSLTQDLKQAILCTYWQVVRCMMCSLCQGRGPTQTYLPTVHVCKLQSGLQTYNGKKMTCVLSYLEARHETCPSVLETDVSGQEHQEVFLRLVWYNMVLHTFVLGDVLIRIQCAKTPTTPCR